MLSEHSLPPGRTPPERVVRRNGLSWRGSVWTPRSLAALAAGLAESGFPELDGSRLAEVWAAAIEDLRDPDSEVRRRLEPSLARLSGLSAPGLSAGLETLLAGAAGPETLALLQGSPSRRSEAPRDGERKPPLVVVVLAATPPALAVQPLLATLAARRPVLLKSSTAEPLFAPALVGVLCRREPRLRPSIAALTWPGGDRELEAPVLGRASAVVAYGGEEALRDLRGRAGAKLLAFGPKLSLALVGRDVDPASVAGGLARDVALFDQRGCLSIQAIYTAGDGDELAGEIARALAARARAWPMGEPGPRTLARVRQLRGVAAMRGLSQPALDLREGTVIVEREAVLEPSPGLRTVRVHPVANLAEVPALLARWRGRLQGAALAGDDAWPVAGALRDLGVSRCAPPGELQQVEACWANGGLRLDELL